VFFYVGISCYEKLSESVVVKNMDRKSNVSISSLRGDPRKNRSLSEESSSELDQLPQSDFLDYVKSLFDIFDTDKKGYVTIDELERYLNSTEYLGEPSSKPNNIALIRALQQICPVNGYINFKRFNLAIQIALGKRSLGRERGIGRSLRPRSFLFAVSEAGDDDVGTKEESVYGREKSVSYSPADSVISSDMDDFSETMDSEDQYKGGYYKLKKAMRSKAKKVESEKGRIAIEEFFLLQKCLLETNKVREIYRARITELEEAIEEDKHITISPTFVYSHAALHVSKISSMNEKLGLLQLPNTSTLAMENISQCFDPQKKIEELNVCISQLENEKSVLVKDYFSLKARYAELEGKKQESVLF